MKQALIMSLIAIALSACVKKEDATLSKEDALREMAIKIYNARVKAKSIAVVTEDGVYVIRKICIDNVSYLAYSHTIVEQHQPDGKPLACE